MLFSYEILKQQNTLHEQRQAGEIPDTVLMVEHTPVITLGARQSANRLLTKPEDLARQDIHCVQIRRGGGTTAHNPGQLVFYPILDLGARGLGLGEYIRSLEEIGIKLLRQLEVEAERKSGFPGLWVGPRKIASIGVKVDVRGTSLHGFALNVNTDPSYWEGIIACGLAGYVNADLAGVCQPAPKMEDVIEELVKAFGEVFDYKIRFDKAEADRLIDLLLRDRLQ